MQGFTKPEEAMSFYSKMTDKDKSKTIIVMREQEVFMHEFGNQNDELF